MAPRPPGFATMRGRDAPDPSSPRPAYARPLDYRVEDIPLTVLAGHRNPAGPPDFSRMRAHSVELPGEREEARSEGGRESNHPLSHLVITPHATPGGARLDSPSPSSLPTNRQ